MLQKFAAVERFSTALARLWWQGSHSCHPCENSSCSFARPKGAIGANAAGARVCMRLVCDRDSTDGLLVLAGIPVISVLIFNSGVCLDGEQVTRRETCWWHSQSSLFLQRDWPLFSSSLLVE